MTRFAFLLAVSALLAIGARAEPVGVRSGDHAGFTRLVVELGDQEDWVFGRVDGGFEFRPGREDVSYRLDRVYDKIGRNRIAEVQDLGDGRLYLGVDCDCHAVVDELSNGRIVLDIATGPASAPGTGVDAALPAFRTQPEDMIAATEAMPADDVEQPVLRAAVVSDRAGLPLTVARAGPLAPVPAPTLRPAQPQVPVLRGTVDAPSGVSEDVGAETPSAADDDQVVPTGVEDRATRIADTEAALLEQVARAAAQGLLDADMSGIDASVAETRPEPVEEPTAPEIAPPPPPVTQRGHITVETSIDRAAAGRARPGGETDEGAACIAPAFFDIATWGEEIANGTDIAAYRSRLVTELDRADGAGISALVRNYIYITFGAEAKALLRNYPDSVERPDLLFAMAEIMDDGKSSRAAELADQMSCDGATALWATLAQAELRPGQALNAEAVSMAFGALPAHLRRHLGPKLADRLLASGELKTADIIRAAIDRAGNPPSSEYGLMTAQFELEAGAVDQATETLDEVVAAGDGLLPEALLQRVEATLASAGAVPDDVVVLLDSLAFQFRGTGTARQMVDAGIRSRASAARFDAAFEQLGAAEAAGLFTPQRSADLRQGLFEKVTSDTDDAAFLRLSLPRLDEVTGLPAEPRRALARRLLDLGLAGPARRALGDDGAMPDVAERELLARAALVENRPAVAIGYLAGLSDPAALALQAEALQMAEDHAGALRAYEAVGDLDMGLTMAWHGGLWPEVAQRDTGTIGTAARLMTGARVSSGEMPDGGQPGAGGPLAAETGQVGAAARPGEDPAGQPALAAARALIAESEAVRQTLSALLSEVAMPDGGTLPGDVPGF